MSELPKGWVECELGDVFKISTGKTPSTKKTEYFNGDIPFVKPGDLDQESELFEAKTTLTLEGAHIARL
ncbi:MAG: restriction endonuclease subunit S, partial [Pseudomonadota bacterium]